MLSVKLTLSQPVQCLSCCLQLFSEISLYQLCKWCHCPLSASFQKRFTCRVRGLSDMRRSVFFFFFVNLAEDESSIEWGKKRTWILILDEVIWWKCVLFHLHDVVALFTWPVDLITGQAQHLVLMSTNITKKHWLCPMNIIHGEGQ
jgi:hypothetical protein